MGYQNSKGYSGVQVDNILKDHEEKATPIAITFSIADLTSDPQVGGFVIPNDLLQENEVGLTIKFTFKNDQVIITKILSKLSYSENSVLKTCYYSSFVSWENSTFKLYKMFLYKENSSDTVYVHLEEI